MSQLLDWPFVIENKQFGGVIVLKQQMTFEKFIDSENSVMTCHFLCKPNLTRLGYLVDDID
jgi:hypothetical protein